MARVVSDQENQERKEQEEQERLIQEQLEEERRLEEERKKKEFDILNRPLVTKDREQQQHSEQTHDGGVDI